MRRGFTKRVEDVRQMDLFSCSKADPVATFKTCRQGRWRHSQTGFLLAPAQRTMVPQPVRRVTFCNG